MRQMYRDNEKIKPAEQKPSSSTVKRRNSASRRRQTENFSAENPFQSGISDVESEFTPVKATMRSAKKKPFGGKSPLAKESKSNDQGFKFMDRPPFPVAGYLDVHQVLEQSRKRMSKSKSSFVAFSFRRVLYTIMVIAIAVVSIHLERWRTLRYCSYDEVPTATGKITFV